MWLRAVAGIGGAAYLRIIGVIFDRGLGFLNNDAAGIIRGSRVYGFNFGSGIFAPCYVAAAVFGWNRIKAKLLFLVGR